MQSIPSFDENHPVKTFFTRSEDWQRNKDWLEPGRQSALLRDCLCVPLKQIRYARETHSGSVLAIPDENGGSIEIPEEAEILGPSGGFDSMVTSVPGVALCIWTADCIPLFLYDPKKHIAAIAHCGWRGICNGIVGNTIRVMARRFDAQPENLITAFGPGICGKCYEVGEELIPAFSRLFPEEEIREFFRPKQNGKYLLNLRKAISFEFLRMGIAPESIRDAGICSYESESFASYRRSGPSEPCRQTLSGIVLL